MAKLGGMLKQHATYETDPANARASEALEPWQPIAERLQLKERAFWRLVHEKGLPHYRLNGRVIRFRWSECEQWLERVRKGAI